MLFTCLGCVLTVLLCIAGLIAYAASRNLSDEDYERGFLHELDGIPERPVDGRYVIVTYNVGYASGLTNLSGHNASQPEYEENLETIIRALKGVDPDFVATQEIDFDSDRSYQQNQPERIARSLGLGFHADALTWDKKYLPFPYWPPKENFGRTLSGQSIVSGFPIRGQWKQTLLRPKNPFWYDWFYVDRIAQCALVRVGDWPLVIVNVHLEAYKQETREVESLEVLAAIKQHMDKPLIVLGDFNSRPPWASNFHGGRALANFIETEGLHKAIPREAYEGDGEKECFTASSSHPRSSIDHIFYNDRIECLTAHVMQDAGTGSDHLPVMMEFSFR
ncbi:MAG: metal-dependent hydrolase [bacterium]|nr:metal-dependent hydrolase [bacterium]